ncbi:MAG: hypothetical protein EXR51_01630 [Dehalococcoidia bacterium]|nr:hypothetical protein [Dehalococcoidia bacterium]
MSLYYVNKVVKLIVHTEDTVARRRWLERPEEVLEGMDLTPEERRALLLPDIAALYSMGAHPALLPPFMAVKDKEGPATLMARYLNIVSGLGHPSIAT